MSVADYMPELKIFKFIFSIALSMKGFVYLLHHHQFCKYQFYQNSSMKAHVVRRVLQELNFCVPSQSLQNLTSALAIHVKGNK